MYKPPGPHLCLFVQTLSTLNIKMRRPFVHSRKKKSTRIINMLPKAHLFGDHRGWSLRGLAKT